MSEPDDKPAGDAAPAEPALAKEAAEAKADAATVNVSLRLPGASPDEMASSVIQPMENALSGIAGIDQLSATVNAGGSATITVRFVLERDLDVKPTLTIRPGTDFGIVLQADLAFAAAYAPSEGSRTETLP